MKSYFILLFLTVLNLPLLAQAKLWELKKESDGIYVFLRDVEDFNIKEIKALKKTDVAFEKLVAVLLDVENMPLWYDRIESVKTLKVYSEMEGVYQIHFGMPWPVKDRYSNIKAKMTYDHEAQKVFVHTAYEEGYPADNEEAVHVKNIRSEWEITRNADDTVSISHSGFMDPTGKVPSWLVNSGLVDGPVKTIKNLIKVAEGYESADLSALE